MHWGIHGKNGNIFQTRHGTLQKRVNKSNIVIVKKKSVMKIPSAQPDNHIHIITDRDKITFSLTIGRYTEFHYSISKETAHIMNNQ